MFSNKSLGDAQEDDESDDATYLTAERMDYDDQQARGGGRRGGGTGCSSAEYYNNSKGHHHGQQAVPSGPVKSCWHAAHIDTVQDLVPEQIRWFYKEDPKSKWIPFIGYDSLRIECRYRALEYARSRSNSLTEDDVDMQINVRGGLYEVDIDNNSLHPIYWKGDSLPIMRGTWFVDNTWQPMEYEHSNQLEHDHLAKFIGQKIPDPDDNSEWKSKNRSVVHRVAFQDFHVEWYDMNEIYMFSESKSSKAYRSVTTTLGMAKAGTGNRISRGYIQEAVMDDKPVDVTHLIFVIHGIGQKANQNRIIHCCNDLRNGTNKLISKHFPALEGSGQRAEFLPVEWRTDLQLDGELVDSITPDKLRQLRTLLNSTAMDILYYTSPLYRGEIIGGLEKELNRLYTMFCDRQPYFEANNGKVSICAHSLGTVITYDILTGWDPIELYDQYVSDVVKASMFAFENGREMLETLTSNQRSEKIHKFYLQKIKEKRESTLHFKVTNFFALGSPLGVFLTLRGLRPQAKGSMDHILPKAVCERFYNIYYPTDPVAYRIEPLVLRHYSTLHPLKIHKLDEQNKTPYAQMPHKACAALSSKKVKSPRSKKREAKMVDSRESYGSKNLESSSSSTISSTGSSAQSPNGASNMRRRDISTTSPYGASNMQRGDNSKTSTVGGSNKGFTGAVKSLFSRFSRQTEEEKLTAELQDYESIGEETSEEEDGPSIEYTELDHRLDYALPSSGTFMSSLNSYVSAIFSHTSYWSSPEVALFLMSHLFPEHGPAKVQ